MNGEQLLDAIEYVDADLIEAAAAMPKKHHSRKKVYTAAACLALVLFGSICAVRLDLFRAGCSATPGTIVDGVYYYQEAHHGVYAYTPDRGTEKVLGKLCYNDFEIGADGLYFCRGRSLYRKDLESGKITTLYRAPFFKSSHAGFQLQNDGSIILRIYNRRRDTRTELLLDGKSGEVLKTLTPEKPFTSREDDYSETHFIVGKRQIELVRLPAEGNDRFYDLTENNVSLLPEKTCVIPYPTQLGDTLWFICYSYPFDEAAEAAKKEETCCILRPDGSDLFLTSEYRYYEGFADQFAFSWSPELICCDITTGEVWPLAMSDPEIEIHGLSTDGDLLFTCVPWSDVQTLWQLEWEDGHPSSITLIDEDITE